MSHRVQLQPSFLLHRRPYRESGQLLEVFTLDFGRLSLVARGVARRRRGGSLASILQPFRPLLLSFSGRGEMATLTGAEGAGGLPVLVGEQVYHALYVNELLMRLLHRHEAHGELFSLYGLTLERLAGSGELSGALRRFELGLINALGYGIDLTREADSGLPIEPSKQYLVDGEHGVIPVCEVQEGVRDTFSGAALLAIGQEEVDGMHARAARQLTARLMSPYLGARPINARMFYPSRRRTAEVSGS